MKLHVKIFSFVLAFSLLIPALFSCQRYGKEANTVKEEITDKVAYKIYKKTVTDEKGKEFRYRIVTFGSYPQSRIQPGVTLSPTPDERGRYTGSDGEKYIKATATNTSGDGSFFVGGDYFFKIEPLVWTISYSFQTEVSYAYLTCLTPLYAPEISFDSEEEYLALVDKWLNEEFYNAAFSSLGQSLIRVPSQTKDWYLEPLGDRKVFTCTTDRLPKYGANATYFAPYECESLSYSEDFARATGEKPVRPAIVITLDF